MSWTSAALAQPRDTPVEPVKLRLVSERTGTAPGGTAHVALVFDLEPSWHLYWNGRNDTGVAPKVTWNVPEGVTVGALQWPAPHRQELGDILDHVYEDRLTLIAPVTLAADLDAGRQLELGAAVTWMVCADVCLLGKGKASLSLKVGEGRATPEAPIFVEARKRLPQVQTEKGAPELSWDENTLIMSAPGATRLSFYPDADSADMANLLRDGQVKGERLSLEVAGEGEVRGVIEIERDGGEQIYRIEAPARK